MQNHPESTFGDYIIKLILLNSDSARETAPPLITVRQEGNKLPKV